MYSINLISSINNSYYPNFKQKQEVQRATNPITTVPMNGLDAMANYNTALINKQNEAPKYIHQSLEEHLSSLKSSKPSNIDYTIETYEPDRCFLNIKDKNGNITDRIEYRDGKFVGCEINTYQGGKLIKRIGRGKDRIETSEKILKILKGKAPRNTAAPFWCPGFCQENHSPIIPETESAEARPVRSKKRRRPDRLPW